MIYIDIIATDEPDSIEITGTKDHKWMGLKDTLNKPKVSLFMLYRLKKFIETSYDRLNKTSEGVEIQGISENTGGDNEVGGDNNTSSSTES